VGGIGVAGREIAAGRASHSYSIPELLHPTVTPSQSYSIPELLPLRVTPSQRYSLSEVLPHTGTPFQSYPLPQKGIDFRLQSKFKEQINHLLPGYHIIVIRIELLEYIAAKIRTLHLQQALRRY
jgi:hypothetical protein